MDKYFPAYDNVIFDAHKAFKVELLNGGIDTTLRSISIIDKVFMMITETNKIDQSSAPLFLQAINDCAISYMKLEADGSCIKPIELTEESLGQYEGILRKAQKHMSDSGSGTPVLFEASDPYSFRKTMIEKLQLLQRFMHLPFPDLKSIRQTLIEIINLAIYTRMLISKN